MPSHALILVVLAGLIHASWNIVAKKSGGDARFACLTALVMMVFWAPLGLWVGARQVPGWSGLDWLLIALSGFLHVAYYLVLLRGYRRADLTVVYPVARGSGPLLASLAAVTLLGERLSPRALAGIAAVAIGVFFVAGGPALLRRAQDARQRARTLSGLHYGLLTGLFIASYTVVDGYGVKVLLLSPILIDYCGNFFRLLWLVPAALRTRAETWRLWRLHWRGATLVGVISPVSYVLVLYAVQVAPLSHVAPAREVSMLFAALLGGHLLGEGDRVARLAGAACIALGVMALAAT